MKSLNIIDVSLKSKTAGMYFAQCKSLNPFPVNLLCVETLPKNQKYIFSDIACNLA